MSLRIAFPPGVEPLEYITTFALAFDLDAKSRGALLGTADSIRQARLIPREPLGLFACMTAQEEAASFLYYALSARGHKVPHYGRLHRHPDKVKVLVAAIVLQNYFFTVLAADFPTTIRLASEAGLRNVTVEMEMAGYIVSRDDPFEMIAVVGTGLDGQQAAVDQVIQTVLSSMVSKGSSVRSAIGELANQRNLAIYGASDTKPRLSGERDIDRYIQTCVSLIAMAILVLNGSGPTESMDTLLSRLFEKLSSTGAEGPP